MRGPGRHGHQGEALVGPGVVLRSMSLALRSRSDAGGGDHADQTPDVQAANQAETKGTAPDPGLTQEAEHEEEGEEPDRLFIHLRDNMETIRTFCKDLLQQIPTPDHCTVEGQSDTQTVSQSITPVCVCVCADRLSRGRGQAVLLLSSQESLLSLFQVLLLPEQPPASPVDPAHAAAAAGAWGGGGAAPAEEEGGAVMAACSPQGRSKAPLSCQDDGVQRLSSLWEKMQLQGAGSFSTAMTQHATLAQKVAGSHTHTHTGC